MSHQRLSEAAHPFGNVGADGFFLAAYNPVLGRHARIVLFDFSVSGRELPAVAFWRRHCAALPSQQD